ncbi:MAG: iron complex outermembrane receptor protein, partial [Arenicella sp.]
MSKFACNICLFILLAISSTSFSQLGEIKGKVSDDFGPLPGAKISVVGTNITSSCDINGEYSIEIKPGTYNITASYLLYKSQTKSVSISFNSLEVVEDFLLASVSPVDANASVGTRSGPKSQLESTAAVDIISPADFAASTQMTLGQFLHFHVPSFHSTRQTISDGTDHVDPGTLRGLGPDQLLVFINGKRRHASSLINVNGTIGRGAVSTDFNAIPLSAIDHIEILRDGASAQYGSDAIAGVINIVLKEQTNVFAISAAYNPTLIGDGQEAQLNANYGLEFENGGFLNVTFEFKQREAYNRAGNYTGNVYDSNDSLDAILISQNDFWNQNPYKDQRVMEIGSGSIFDATTFGNLLLPMKGKGEFYANGGISYRQGKAHGFYRLPHQEEKVVEEFFPNGFSPEIQTDIVDNSVTLGMRNEKNGWLIDFSNSTGNNKFDFTVNNSNNASMGVASPTTVYAGGFEYNQNITNFDFSKKLDSLWFLKGFNMGFGSEFRLERYEISAGEVESWTDGGDTTSSGAEKAAGFQVFPGFQPQNSLRKNRTNFAGYVDLEINLTEKWLLAAALRFENYGLFGSNLSWKVASRYKFSDKFSIRASYNTGFRAPSLHQIYFSNVGTQFVNGEALQVGTFNNESATAKAFGADGLMPEKSLNVSAGFTAKISESFSMSADAYYIGIKDRIVLSGQLGAGFESILNPGGASTAQIFLNGINSETMGFDVGADFSKKIGKGLFKARAAFNFSKTNVLGSIETSGALQGAEDLLFNRDEISRLELAQPRTKTILILQHTLNRWNFMLKNTRFGEVHYIHPSDE